MQKHSHSRSQILKTPKKANPLPILSSLKPLGARMQNFENSQAFVRHVSNSDQTQTPRASS